MQTIGLARATFIPQSENGLHIKMEVNRLIERQVLKIFFPDVGFRAPFNWILGPCNSSGMWFHVSFWPRLRILPACFVLFCFLLIGFEFKDFLYRIDRIRY